MRLIFTIIFLYAFSVNAQTTYYISNSGNDANNGTSTVTPWKTIAKENSFSHVPGDQILFSTGNIWIEKLVPKNSGTSANPIKYGSYGTGAKPVITGLKKVTPNNNTGNIWSITIPDAASSLNVVKVNGTIAAKARYPNTGYLTATSVLSNTSLRIPHDAVNRVGSEIVILSQPWVLDVATITSHNTGASYDTLNFSNVRASADPGLYYFYQNKANLLDTLNEWSFDGTTLSVYATSQLTIEYSTLDTLVKLYRKDNIKIDGIKFEGANTYAVFIDSSRYDSIKNTTLNNNNAAIYALRHRWTGITSDTLKNSLSYSYFSYQDTSFSFINNFVDSTGMLAGMGGSGFSTYGGGYNQGNYATFRYNKFLHAGYHGIRWGGQNDTIEYNYVDGFNYHKNDGGGIYTYAGNGNSAVNYNSVVRNNIITNGYGNVYGGNYSVGIYLDDYVDSVLVEGNTISNMLVADIQTKGMHNKIINNTFYDSTAYNLYSSTDYLTVKGNVFYNKHASNASFYLDNTRSNFFIDSNYYQAAYAVNFGGARTFDQWRATSPSLDVHSTTALPYGTTSTTGTLYPNPTLTTYTYSVSGGYITAKGAGYENTITLAPFQSALVWPSKYKNPTPLNNIKFKTIIYK